MVMRKGTLGHRVAVERRFRGWTQEKLARKAGTNQAVIQKIENGGSLRPRKIMEIAAALKVNPAWLQFGPNCAVKGVLPESMGEHN